jgi:hypothetical protein
MPTRFLGRPDELPDTLFDELPTFDREVSLGFHRAVRAKVTHRGG